MSLPRFLGAAPTPTLAPVQVTIPLSSTIAFSRLDASQTSRPHVFLLTSKEELLLSLDSFTRSTTEIDFQATYISLYLPISRYNSLYLPTTEIDFQATDDLALQSWLDDLQYVCSDPIAAPPARKA